MNKTNTVFTLGEGENVPYTSYPIKKNLVSTDNDHIQIFKR